MGPLGLGLSSMAQCHYHIEHTRAYLVVMVAPFYLSMFLLSSSYGTLMIIFSSSFLTHISMVSNLFIMRMTSPWIQLPYGCYHLIKNISPLFLKRTMLALHQTLVLDYFSLPFGHVSLIHSSLCVNFLTCLSQQHLRMYIILLMCRRSKQHTSFLSIFSDVTSSSHIISNLIRLLMVSQLLN